MVDVATALSARKRGRAATQRMSSPTTGAGATHCVGPTRLPPGTDTPLWAVRIPHSTPPPTGVWRAARPRATASRARRSMRVRGSTREGWETGEGGGGGERWWSGRETEAAHVRVAEMFAVATRAMVNRAGEPLLDVGGMMSRENEQEVRAATQDAILGLSSGSRTSQTAPKAVAASHHCISKIMN